MTEIPNFDPKKLEIVRVEGSHGHDMSDIYITEAYYDGVEFTDEEYEWFNNKFPFHQIFTEKFN